VTRAGGGWAGPVILVASVFSLGVEALYFVHQCKKAKGTSDDVSAAGVAVLAEAKGVVDAEFARLRHTIPRRQLLSLRFLPSSRPHSARNTAPPRARSVLPLQWSPTWASVRSARRACPNCGQ